MERKVKELLSQSRHQVGTNIDKAVESAGKAVELSREMKLTPELSYSLISYADCLSEKGEKLLVLESIFEALSLAKEMGDKSLLVSCYSALGTIYLRQGDLDKAYTAYNEASGISRTDHGDNDLSEVLFGLGTILYWKENYREAAEYFENARGEALRHGNTVYQLKILNNLGCSYHHLNEWEKAEETLRECVSRCHEEEYYYTLISSLDELGVIYHKKGDERALSCWHEALEVSKNRGDSHINFGPLLSLARYYLEEKDREKADFYLNLAKSQAEKSGASYDLADLYKLQASFFETRGDYKSALDYQKKYVNLWQNLQKQKELWELKNRELELLSETRDRIAALSSMGRIITSSLDLKTILFRSYDNLKKILDFSILGIARFNEEKQEIFYELFIEKGKSYPSITTSLNDQNSLAAWAIRHDKMVLISDFKKECLHFIKSWEGRTRLGEGTEIVAPQSIIYNPLKIENRIIGVITIQSYRKNCFSEKDVEAFEMISSYTAIALNNAIRAEEIRKQNEVLSKMATTDSLTGLYNRRYFFDTLERYYSLAKRRKLPFSLIMMDLDYFKKVNDNFGHPAGDHILREVASLLGKHIRRSHDSAARLGGEEFGLFLGDSDYDGALSIAEEIRSKIASHVFLYENTPIPLTASLGVVTRIINRDSEAGYDEVFRMADKLLYDAKHNGRNCVKGKEYT